MWDVLAKMRECGKDVKMRDFPHDCGMVDAYVVAIIVWCILQHSYEMSGSYDQI